MGRWKYLLAVVAAAAAVLAPASVQAASSVQLSRDVVHNLNLATPLGPVAATRQLTVGVVLANPNQAAEDAYLKSLYTPSSSNYQHFLDSSAFAAKFGVPSSTVQAATTWLQHAGLKISTVGGSTNYLLAQGTAAQIESAFQTPLASYHANGRDFYANLAAPAVPSSLPVATVLGLNDYNRFSTPHSPQTATAKWTTGAPGANAPVTGLLHPRDLWSLYDMPSTNLGNGRAMAVLGWGVTDPVLNDLRDYEAENKLPATPLTVSYYGDTSTPDTNDGATVEWELDTQASTGMAPNAVYEHLYFAHHNTDADILAALTAWVNDKNGPNQASASFGECENIPAAENVIGTDGLEAPGDQMLKQAVIEGKTLFVSTGDTGSSCPIVPANTNGAATQLYPALNYPSSSRWAVAVGGTDLTSDGGTPAHRLAETAWEFGGGGNSTVETAGDYQHGIAPTNCTTDASGNTYAPGTAPLCRATPDVAAISGDVVTGNGLLITDDSGVDQQGAGTSLSAPLWLGMWTRIQAASPKILGFANYYIYKIGKGPNYGNDFYDVTVGDNLPYPAKPGWDNATGFGTPDVAHLMQDLTGSLTPAYNTTPAPIAQFKTTSTGDLFTDPAGDDNFNPEGAGIGSVGAAPQLDILSGKMLMSADGKTLRTIITVKNLTTTIPVGGVENDYNFVWSYNGVQYFTQLAVEPGGTVQGYDGQLIKVSLENRYQQFNVDTGKITTGPNGTVEVDVPLANIGNPASSSVLVFPSAASYVREGLLAGPLEPADSGGPGVSFLLP